MNEKKISVVIPVYNVELYLAECIDSVINQTIDFEKNIEIVLVNDGSKDGSGAICESYLEKYPDNIIYISQENSGVSAARNAGVAAATGEFIGFLDSDDKFSEKVVYEVIRYFNIALDASDIVVVPVTNFGAKSLPYYLNDKSKRGMRTIEVDDPNWYDVVMRVGQAFVRASVAKKYRFDEDITYFEDSKYITQIIMEKRRIGVVTGCSYLYRRFDNERDDGVSLTTSAETNKRLYLDTLNKVVLPFMEPYKDGTDTPMYYQYLALCAMRWPVFFTSVEIEDVLSEEEMKLYEGYLQQIMDHMSDEAIIKYNALLIWQRLFLLDMKYEDCINKITYGEGDNLAYLGDMPFFNISKVDMILMDVNVEEDVMTVKGYFKTLQNSKLKGVAIANGVEYEMTPTEQEVSPTKFSLHKKPHQYTVYSVEIPLKDEDTVVEFALKETDNLYMSPAIKPHPNGCVERTNLRKNTLNGYILCRNAKNLETHIDNKKNRKLYFEEPKKKSKKKAKSSGSSKISTVKKIVRKVKPSKKK